MGIFKTQRMIELGQINCKLHKRGVLVSIPYTCDESCRLNVIIQNELGRSVFESNFELEAEDGSLEIEIPRLEEGKYNAWIDANGNMFLRNFTVPVRSKDGIWAWLKDKLS